jgi:hypothetical protein
VIFFEDPSAGVMPSAVLPTRAAVAQIANLLAVLRGAGRSVLPAEGELMSAESSLTAVAVVRALLDEDTEGLVVLLPDDLPEPGRELIASLASLTVLSVKVAARGRAHYGRRVPGQARPALDEQPGLIPGW